MKYLGNVRRNGILPWQQSYSLVKVAARGVERQPNETLTVVLHQEWLQYIARFSTSHYSPLKSNLLVPWNCATKKSMWRHHPPTPPPHPSLQSGVLPNTVREFILFMRSRFTEGQQLGPDSLMAGPPFITAEPALWSRLGSHLAQRIETPLKYSIMH